MEKLSLFKLNWMNFFIFQIKKIQKKIPEKGLLKTRFWKGASRAFILIITCLILFLFIPAICLADEDTQKISFDPSYILSDHTLTNWQAMTEEQVENFLKEKNGALANYRAIDIDGKEKSAGQIIYQASKRHQINPQVIITLIQKEQTLVTQQAKKPSQFDWATGFGCLDNRSPIKKFAGFSLQVDKAAWRLRYYLEHPWEFPIAKGRTTYISGILVTPKNAATAALYNYTPHLAGNKLFWTIFQKWFREYEDSIGENSLVRAQGEKGVWLISNGEKRPFLSKTIFLLGYRFEDVKVVPKTLLQKYPLGEPMTFPNFSLVKTPQGIIYLIDNGKKRQISEEMFKKIGFHPEEIIELNQQDLKILDTYEQGEPITTLWIRETLLQDKTTHGVWLVKDNYRQAIIDKIILETNFPYQKIIKVDPRELESLEIRSPLKLQDGTLIKLENKPEVYVIAQGKKLHIPNPETFEALGYSWSAIITVPEKVFNLHPSGEPIAI